MLEQSIDHERVRPDLLSFLPEEYCRLTAEEQRVSLALYRLLAGADPVGLEPLADAAQLSEHEVRGMLGRWGGVYYDDDGRVIAYWGLALPRMAHRFEVAGRTLYTWCAWDSLFLPELLNATAHVQSTCPTTGAAIKLTVSPDAIEWVDPPRVVMSFREPDPSQVRRDVITTFCTTSTSSAPPTPGVAGSAGTRGRSSSRWMRASASRGGRTPCSTRTPSDAVGREGARALPKG